MSLTYTVNCSLLYKELPLLERPAAVKAAGFEAVEYWWPFNTAVPADADVDAFVSAITDAGVQLTGLNFFAGDMPGGERGLVCLPNRSSEFRDNIAVVVEIGQRLGCRAFNALYGNRPGDSSPAEQDEVALENLTLAANALDAIGGTVLLEPVSGAPDYPLTMAADAIGVIDRVQAGGVANIGLLMDLFHLAANGDDLDKAIELYTPRTAHVQIADFPGRGEPGTGSLPIETYLRELAARGYDGYVGLEYNPVDGTAAGLSWVPPHCRTHGSAVAES